MIREYLYQHELVPLGAKTEAVIDLKYVLMEKLLRHLHQQYRWFVFTESALRASCWGGERRRQQRLKLRRMIQVCCAYLGETDVTSHFSEGWENQGLYFGQGAIFQYAKDYGLQANFSIQLSSLFREMGVIA